jgi:hypothetical protein
MPQQGHGLPDRSSGKNLSVRLPAEHLSIVMAHAKVEDITMGEVIRNAILAYNSQRACDPEFVRKVNTAQQQLGAVLLPGPHGSDGPAEQRAD